MFFSSYHTATFNYQEALQRSLDLLTSWLTPKQTRMFKRYGIIPCRGSVTGDRYYIYTRTTVFNVFRPMKHIKCNAGYLYCARFYDFSIPKPDLLLAQKLMIETNESEFLAVANCFSFDNGIPLLVDTPRY